MITLPILATLFIQPALAGDAEDMAEMQKKLNAEMADLPFLAEQPEKVEAYIKDSLKNNVVPPPYRGTYWRPGYTCHNLLRYNWREYRNCRYYHRYYGRYY